MKRTNRVGTRNQQVSRGHEMAHNFFLGFLLQNVQGLISGLLDALSTCNFGRIFSQFQLYVYNEVPPFVCHLMPVPPRPGKTGPMSHQPTMVFSTQATKYLHLYKSLLLVKYFYSKLSGCVFCLRGGSKLGGVGGIKNIR